MTRLETKLMDVTASDIIVQVKESRDGEQSQIVVWRVSYKGSPKAAYISFCRDRKRRFERPGLAVVSESLTESLKDNADTLSDTSERYESDTSNGTWRGRWNIDELMG